MRSFYILLPVTAMTVMSSIVAAPVTETIQRSANPRTLNANNLVKRQSNPICSDICGSPAPDSCLKVFENGAMFCTKETFTDPTGGDCRVSYTPPSDGTCLTPPDLLQLIATLGNTCLAVPSGGCIEGASGVRVCMFSKESPCH